MGGYLYRGREWDSGRGEEGYGLLERVSSPSFCEFRGCIKLAEWRIGSKSYWAEFCPKHTLSTMRNRKVWVRPG